jgi:hypothetical protein
LSIKNGQKKRIYTQTYLALKKAQGYTTFDLGNGPYEVSPSKQKTFFYFDFIKKKEWFLNTFKSY